MEIFLDIPIRGKEDEIWGFKEPIWREVEESKGLEDCLREASCLRALCILDWASHSTRLLESIGRYAVAQYVWNNFHDIGVSALVF